MSAVKTVPEKEIKYEKVSYWTDSETLLAQKKATLLENFISQKKYGEISNLDNCWHYIETEQNPADITRMLHIKIDSRGPYFSTRATSSETSSLKLLHRLLN